MYPADPMEALRQMVAGSGYTREDLRVMILAASAQSLAESVDRLVDALPALEKLASTDDDNPLIVIAARIRGLRS